MDKPNSDHPVDELAELRLQRRVIERRIDDLRETILRERDLRGDEHTAKILPIRGCTYRVVRRPGRAVRTKPR